MKPLNFLHKSLKSLALKFSLQTVISFSVQTLELLHQTLKFPHQTLKFSDQALKTVKFSQIL